MAIAYMTRVTIPKYENRIDQYGFEYEETLDSAGNGNSVLIPDVVRNIGVTLQVLSGTGKIQTTTNKVQDVIDDNNVVWVDWDSGVVSTTTQDSCSPVTALRMVNVSGEQRLLMRAQ